MDVWVHWFEFHNLHNIVQTMVFIDTTNIVDEGRSHYLQMKFSPWPDMHRI